MPESASWLARNVPVSHDQLAATARYISCGKTCGASFGSEGVPGARVGFEPPTAAGSDEYTSDPAKPVPFVPRPVRFESRDQWASWLVSDQRAVVDRPDVMVYTSDRSR
jgi:uncharacterized protein